MVLHDYLTTISCDMCSKELSIERNIGEKRMKKIAAKHGWKEADGNDVCPGCAGKLKKKEDNNSCAASV